MPEVLKGLLDIEVCLRLLVAVGGGSAIGLNRFLRHKAAGTRTHAIVALGAAMAALVADRTADVQAISRMAQGVLTGVGFIGAGVILRHGHSHIQGLTTAASVWTCAIYGICCGMGDLAVALTGLALGLLILLIGKPFELAVEHIAQDEKSPPPSRPESSGHSAQDRYP
jgi:putative Mg2+ transporter-C (MgtC) family protein